MGRAGAKIGQKVRIGAKEGNGGEWGQKKKMGAKEEYWTEQENGGKEENGGKRRERGQKNSMGSKVLALLTTDKRTAKHHPQNVNSRDYLLPRSRSGFWQTDGRTNPPSPFMAPTRQTDRQTNTIHKMKNSGDAP